MKRKKFSYNKAFILFFSLLLIALITGCNGGSTPTVLVFSASPTNIGPGESSTLTWSVSNADTVTITPDVGSIALSGTTSVSPEATTTYTISATNAAGSVTASVTVTFVETYGSIDISSSPDGATVYLDGVDTGQITPIILTSVPVGTHTVKLEKYHYESKEDADVLVMADETAYLNWDLNYAPTETFTIQPGSEGKDADVVAENPDQNSGNVVVLFIGDVGSFGTWRAYLQFELSPNPLPADAIVIDARLKLYQNSSSDSGGFSVGLYPVTSSWAESEITWNNQPTSSSEELTFQAVYPSSGTWRIWYIEDLVKGWLDGSISNYGILLKPTDEASNDKYGTFRSSDYTNDSTKRPKLEIDYYIP